MESSDSPRRGRPRSFDPTEVLDRAMRVFWRKGYESTSLSDLTAATGVNRPSLYTAFGNKESLFRHVLDHYMQGPSGYFPEALAAPTAREVVERLLRGAVNLATDARSPTGCLWVRGALSYGDGPPRMRREMYARRRAGERALSDRLEEARASGDLPPDADPEALARFYQTAHFGIQVQAACGARRADLEKVVEEALRALPAPVSEA
ncbi:MAG: TetR/AcrR family transcriptional regulator [Gemmatimonadetes bacterium]|nr:TetR/AcrR family transcriptional regulator [Gemmatimonadota bacterium]